MSYSKPGHRIYLSVPVHGNKSLRKGTLKDLLKDAGLWDKI